MKKVISGKTIIAVAITILLGFAIKPTPTMAYMYVDEKPTAQLIIDKQITIPNISGWQDNLPTSQTVLTEGDLVRFQITIKNSGDKDLNKIQIIDTLPNYLSIIFNPGDYDQENNQIKWQIDKLKAGDKKTFEIRAHIDLSKENIVDGTLCLINKVEAKAETGESDQDTVSFCIIVPQVLPEAGSGIGEILVGTGFAAMIGLAGVLLRKYGRGEI